MQRIGDRAERLAWCRRLQHLVDTVEARLGLSGTGGGRNHLAVQLLELEIAEKTAATACLDNVILLFVLFNRPRRGIGLVSVLGTTSLEPNAGAPCGFVLNIKLVINVSVRNRVGDPHSFLSVGRTI